MQLLALQPQGLLLAFVPRTQLDLHTPEERLATYTFNKHVIRHHFCPTCGCAPFGCGKDAKGADTAAINVRCLPDLDRTSLEVAQVDGKSR